jgi:branched-chain amino acid transport system permease protein
MSGIASVSFAGTGALSSYIVALALAGVVCLAALRLSSSRTGRAWAAIREDDVAAAAVGINPPLMKLLAFAIGAGVAGVAGAGFAQLFGYVEPGQFDFTVSLMVLSAVVIGGRWGVLGAVGGALVIAAYDRFLVDVLSAGLHVIGLPVDLRQHNYIVFGVALLVATLARARGGEPSAVSGQQSVGPEPTDLRSPTRLTSPPQADR